MPPDKGRGRPGGGDLKSMRGGDGHQQGTADVVDLAAAFTAAARGCTCAYDLIVTGVTVGGIRHVHVAHDDGCPALEGGDAA